MCSLWQAPGYLSIPRVLNMKTSTICGLGGSAAGGSVGLAQHGQALFAEAGLLEIPTQVIHRLHQAVLAPHGPTPGPCSVVGPSSRCTVEGCTCGLPTMERHSEVLRPRAVAIGSGQNVVPQGLEVVTIGVGQWGCQAVDWWGGGWLLQGRLQMERLCQAEFLRVGGRLAHKTRPCQLASGSVLARQARGRRPTSLTAHLLEVGQLVLVPGHWLEVASVASGGSRDARGQVDRACGRMGVLHGVDHTGRHWSGDVVGRHPGACIDEQTATNGAGVGDLALAH